MSLGLTLMTLNQFIFHDVCISIKYNTFPEQLSQSDIMTKFLISADHYCHNDIFFSNKIQVDIPFDNVPRTK